MTLFPVGCAGLPATPALDTATGNRTSATIIDATDTRTNQGSIYAAMEALRLLDELYATLA